MGFCIFEDWDRPGAYFAVNSSHVKDFYKRTPVSGEAAHEHCLIVFANSLGVDGVPERFTARGSEEQIGRMLDEAAKIGVTKCNLNILGNLSAKPVPFLVNNTDRIGAVREIASEILFQAKPHVTTASVLLFADGQHRLITERPGQFALNANAGGQVPILRIES